MHACPDPAQFLKETTVRKTSRISTTGLVPPLPGARSYEAPGQLSLIVFKTPALSKVCSAMLGKRASGQHVFLGSLPGQPAAPHCFLLGFQLLQDRVLAELQPPRRLPPRRPVRSPCRLSAGEKPTPGDTLRQVSKGAVKAVT